jgi:hypothetical protein
MISSVTRLRVRSVWRLPMFLLRTLLAQRQVTRADGFYGGRLLVDSHNTYWTLTVWQDERAMKKFRGSGSHAKVMPALVESCDEAAYTHWTSEGPSVPTWPEAYERLLNEGKLSRVNHPSADHVARRFPQPRLQPLIGQNIKPAHSGYHAA